MLDKRAPTQLQMPTNNANNVLAASGQHPYQQQVPASSRAGSLLENQGLVSERPRTSLCTTTSEGLIKTRLLSQQKRNQAHLRVIHNKEKLQQQKQQRLSDQDKAQAKREEKRRSK